MRITTWVVAVAAASSLAMLPQRAQAHDEPVKGSFVGAGIGAVVGGPPGAAVGAVIGAAIGSHVAHETDHGNGHAGHRHYSRARIHEHHREDVAYAVPARYDGNGSTARYHSSRAFACEPARPYRATVVHRDDRPRMRPVAEKAKVKRVCKYVPVRAANTASANKRYPYS